MSLYLYALVADPLAPSAAGLAGEPLETLDCACGFAVFGRMTASPTPTPAALRAHHELVRELAQRAAALLPARFGELAADERELRASVDAQADALGMALEAVREREQMTVRIFSDTETPREPARSGTEYLEQRRARAPAEAQVRERVAELVTAERIDRGRPPLACSLHHLVARGVGEEYRRRLETLELDGARLSVSGPWAPYAFAPALGASTPEEDET